MARKSKIHVQIHGRKVSERKKDALKPLMNVAEGPAAIHVMIELLNILRCLYRRLCQRELTYRRFGLNYKVRG